MDFVILLLFVNEISYSFFRNNNHHLHASDFNPDLLDRAMVKSYVSSVKQEYI